MKALRLFVVLFCFIFLATFAISEDVVGVDAGTPDTQSKRDDSSKTVPVSVNDKLNEKGASTEASRSAALTKKYEAQLPWDNYASRYPGVGDTLTGEIGGVRPWMLRHHLGFETIEISSFNYNVANPPMYGANGPDANGNYYAAKAGTAQGYIGQRPTAYLNSIPSLTWNVTKSTQIHVGMYHVWTSCLSCSQDDTLRFQSLNIKQAFFEDRRLKVTAGFINSATQFWGPYTAGNLAGSLLGSLSFMPQLAGESSAYAPAPGITARYEFRNSDHSGPSGYYSQTQIAQSTDPNIYYSGNYHNVFQSIHLHVPGAKAFLTEEIGYKVSSNREGRYQKWIRGDIFYNFSQFSSYAYLAKQSTKKMTDNNFCLAELADIQLSQPDRSMPHRGAYIGNTIQYVPQLQNLYTQFYELRYYYLAPFRSRPNDLWNISVNDMEFSRPYIAMQLYYANLYHKSATYNRNQINIKSQYVARVRPGLNWNVVADWDIRPTIVPKTPNAFVMSTGLVLYF